MVLNPKDLHLVAIARRRLDKQATLLEKHIATLPPELHNLKQRFMHTPQVDIEINEKNVRLCPHPTLQGMLQVVANKSFRKK